jgi:diguanylate cyclase (GGDEF)-like protein
MRIRTYLAVLIFTSLLGGYSLEYVLSNQFIKLKQYNNIFTQQRLLVKDLEHVKSSISQFLVSADLVLASGNTYLVFGAQQQAFLLNKELNNIKDKMSDNRGAMQLGKILEAVNGINHIFEQTIQSDLSNNTQTLQLYDQISETIVDNITQVISSSMASYSSDESYLRELEKQSTLISYSARTLFLFLIFILWYWFSKKICDPIWSLRLASIDALSGNEIKKISKGPKEITELHNHIKTLTDQLTYQVERDPLTGLYNRRVFEKALEKTCINNQQIDALVFIDLDYFKTINDSQGHAIGDQALLAVAEVLKSKLRISDIVARIGGDEFAIILQGCSLSFAQKISESIRENINQISFGKNNDEIRLSISVGLTLIKNNIKNIAIPLHHADVACRKSKQKGRNIVTTYDESLENTHSDDIRLLSVNQINHALANNLFALYKQDIVNLADPVLNKRIEILVRLVNQEGDIFLPNQFLPVAERYHISNKIDRWVINEVLDWFTQQTELLNNIEKISINLSAQSIGDDEIEQFVIDKLAETNFPSKKLCFEITETSAIVNLKKARKFMNQIINCGCSFALDDFGSGHSSYSNIKELPTNMIKIDGSFVKNMLNDPVDLATVKSICTIANVTEQYIVAEYVESKEIAIMLEVLGVKFAQGYYFSKPEPINTLLPHD